MDLVAQNLFIYAHDFKYKILMTMAGDYAKV